MCARLQHAEVATIEANSGSDFVHGDSTVASNKLCFGPFQKSLTWIRWRERGREGKERGEGREGGSEREREGGEGGREGGREGEGERGKKRGRKGGELGVRRTKT